MARNRKRKNTPKGLEIPKREYKILRKHHSTVPGMDYLSEQINPSRPEQVSVSAILGPCEVWQHLDWNGITLRTPMRSRHGNSNLSKGMTYCESLWKRTISWGHNGTTRLLQTALNCSDLLPRARSATRSAPCAACRAGSAPRSAPARTRRSCPAPGPAGAPAASLMDVKKVEF